MHQSRPSLVIDSSRAAGALNLDELWRYRGLLYFLVWRDVKVRYKQTAFGVAWAVMQPFFAMIVFSFFFGRLSGVGSDGAPYPLFAFTALVPWTFFANALGTASNSLVASQNLVTKVYFPRLILPLASVCACLVDFTIAFGVLVGMMVFYGIAPTVHIIYLPALLLLALVTALGVGVWFAALNVRYRDVAQVMPFIVQVWFFGTPIVYSAKLVPAAFPAALQPLYRLNPMVSVVEGFRWALLGTAAAPGPEVILSAAAALAVLVGGAYYFRALERTFADVV